jgi:hypothetical protein
MKAREIPINTQIKRKPMPWRKKPAIKNVRIDIMMAEVSISQSLSMIFLASFIA